MHDIVLANPGAWTRSERIYSSTITAALLSRILDPIRDDLNVAPACAFSAYILTHFSLAFPSPSSSYLPTRLKLWVARLAAAEAVAGAAVLIFVAGLAG